MGLLGLDHFSLRTRKLEETRAFFVDVLGLKEGRRPPFKFPGAWLYVAGHPVVHLIGVDSETDRYLGASDITGSSAADHIAFKCEDPGFFRAKFTRLGVEFLERKVPESDTIQLFLKEPNGFTVELQFPLERN